MAVCSGPAVPGELHAEKAHVTTSGTVSQRTPAPSFGLRDTDLWIPARRRQSPNGTTLPSWKTTHKRCEFSRSECPAFVLEGFGDDQRLRFDSGADRVVIGETPKEPEREWLSQVLDG
jgi:hypothetical protein